MSEREREGERGGWREGGSARGREGGREGKGVRAPSIVVLTPVFKTFIFPL